MNFPQEVFHISSTSMSIKENNPPPMSIEKSEQAMLKPQLKLVLRGNDKLKLFPSAGEHPSPSSRGGKCKFSSYDIWMMCEVYESSKRQLSSLVWQLLFIRITTVSIWCIQVHGLKKHLRCPPWGAPQFEANACSLKACYEA